MTFRSVLALVALTSFAAAPLSAQAINKLGLHDAWEANTSTERGQRVCFMVSEPTMKEPAEARRGVVQAFVTHRPGEKARDVVSFSLGYPIKPSSTVRAVIGGKTIALIPNGEWAWAKDAGDDKALVQAMINGSAMTLAGESERGTKTVDSYSLKGFAAAYKEINKACGLK
jgi:invasion protein IalB